jgi:predicted nucleic acid-binding protein
MKAVLDAGAFVAVERRDRRVRALLQVLQEKEVDLLTSSAVIAQVWRDGRRQARLAQLLGGVGVRALAPTEDRRTGELLARAHTSDVVDGHLSLCVANGDQVLTSDRSDMERLLEARGVGATVVEV